MKKQIFPVLSLIVVVLLFSACPKNSRLAQSKQKKAPAKKETKTTINPERIKEKLSEEIAEMRERREAHEKYDQPREAAEFYKLKRVPVGETEIPVEKYLQAKEQMREMRQYSSAENRFLPSRAEMERSPQREANLEALGNWTPLGPGNIGGRTRALIIHPTGTNVMYAGGVAGGVWKTTNGGANWTPIGDLLPNIAVSALAFDPANPDIIYAGTGEGYYNGDGLRGAGIFKSVDGGVNWARIASTDTPDFYYVNDIIVSHNNSNNIYVATKSGVWRTINGGANWENVLVASGGLGCTDLVIRKDKTTDYLFAASSNGGTSAAKIFRNDNASTVAGIWTNVYSESGMDRAAIAISPSNPNVVYAVASTSVRGIYQYGLHAVWRSTSSGDSGTWTTQVTNSDAVKLNTLLFTNPLAATYAECNFAPNNFYSQGDYDMAIAIDPTDENRVWVGGIDLFRSDDGGRNWGLASYWWAEPTDPSYSHADNHIIVFHPNYNGGTNKKMFVGSDGGISRTDDARASLAIGEQAACNPANTSVRWTSLNNNYGVTQFYHGAVFPDGKSYFGGAQDNGTLLGSDTAGVNGWKEIYGGDGGYVAIDPTNPNILYSSTPGGNFRKSTDGGKTWGDATFGIDRQSDAFDFITPLAIDPNNPQNLWTGGSALYRTTNGAANWNRVQARIYGPNSYSISTITVASTDSNYVLAGTRDGYIHRSTEALNTIASTEWKYSRPTAGYVSSVVFDPNDKNIAYATISTFYKKHVWKSINAGESWLSIDGNLPDLPVHCLVIDPDNTSRLFIGTDMGGFASTDGGANWVVENSGFANTPVEWLSINSSVGLSQLYAFTHGRGTWRINLGASGCRFLLSQSEKSFDDAGGSASFTVSGGNNCNWSAINNADWVIVTSSSTGNGAQVFSYYVTPNKSLVPRIGTITIGGRSFTIKQSAKIDVNAPILNILSPTPESVFRTESKGLAFTGTATDDTTVTLVSWVSDRGNAGNANGTTTWVIPYIPLFRGANGITITAKDISGKSISKTLTVFSDSNSEYLIHTVAGIGEGASQGGYGGDGALAGSAQLNFPQGSTIDALGNLYIADTKNHRVRRVSPNGVISTVTGTGVLGFSGDGGLGINAQLYEPSSVVIDNAGNLFIADSRNNRIRKVTVDTGIITTIAGNGVEEPVAFSQPNGDGGSALAASIRAYSLAIDQESNIYLTGGGSASVRKVNVKTGTITKVIGCGGSGFNDDGIPASTACLSSPLDVALDKLGNIYVADSSNYRIRKVDTKGIISTIAGNGEFQGTANDGELAINASIAVSGVAVDSGGNVFFISRDISSNSIRKIQSDTGRLSTITGTAFGFGGDDGPAKDALLRIPTEVSIGNRGELYIADYGNHRIRILIPNTYKDITKPVIKITSPSGINVYNTSEKVISITGNTSDDVAVTHVTWRNDRGGSGLLNRVSNWNVDNIELQVGPNIITFIAWDAAGNFNLAALSVTYSLANIVTNLAGTTSSGFNLESGSSLSSPLYAPETVAVDNSGNIFIADKGNHRIRKITRAGVISTVAGNGQIGSSGDGGLAINAPFNSPNGVAVDNSGNIYIADTNNQRIRKVNSAGIISTIAGSGIQGFDGDGSANPAAQQLDTPVGISLDVAGNLLIADAGNHRIRKLNLTSGVLTTIAGKGYGSGTPDGTAALNTFLRYPTSVVADAAGNIYISNTSGHNIKKINSVGILTNYAGNGAAGFSGDGSSAKLAQFDGPGGIALDAAGNLYVTDQNNHCLRKIDASGVISTFAGRGGNINLKDPVIAPTDANFYAPAGVVVDRAGNIIIADTNNHRVVMISAFKNVASVNGASFQASLPVAPESIASAFGNNLAVGAQAATTLPLPTELSGTTVKVRDSAGVERLAPLFYAGAGQVNYQIPAGTAAGFATIIITNSNGEISTGAVNVTTTQPGIFSATSDGAGAAAATLLFIKNGVRTGGVVAPCTAQGCPAIPIDVNAYDETFLELYGTGIRANSGLSNVTATIGGTAIPVLYAGAHCCFVGVDQLNLPLPKSLAGKGLVDVVLTVDGKIANAVKINLK